MREQLLEEAPKLTPTYLQNELDQLRESRNSSYRAYPLLVAHQKLDEASAYGWEWPLDENKIPTRLLALNLERAGEELLAVAD